MLKLTLLYGHPLDSSAFETYYSETHIPLAEKIPHVDRVELTLFAAGAGNEKPAYYWMAELYFTGQDAMNNAMISDEGKTAVDDLKNFATGGVTTMIGTI